MKPAADLRDGQHTPWWSRLWARLLMWQRPRPLRWIAAHVFALDVTPEATHRRRWRRRAAYGLLAGMAIGALGNARDARECDRLDAKVEAAPFSLTEREAQRWLHEC